MTALEFHPTGKMSITNLDETAWLDRVLRLAEARGIAQARIVEAAGVEAARVDKWRRGVVKPYLQNVVAIAELLDVSVDWIATGSGAEHVGFPREPISEEERHLLWMLKSIGVSPKEAAARVIASQPIEGVSVLAGRYRSAPPDRDPAGADAHDEPAVDLPGRGRRRRTSDLDLPDVGPKGQKDRK